MLLHLFLARPQIQWTRHTHTLLLRQNRDSQAFNWFTTWNNGQSAVLDARWRWQRCHWQPFNSLTSSVCLFQAAAALTTNTQLTESHIGNFEQTLKVPTAANCCLAANWFFPRSWSRLICMCVSELSVLLQVSKPASSSQRSLNPERKVQSEKM